MNEQDIINKIIKTEGGYVNDPSDSGGETNYGITVAVARNNGYKGEMIDLPRTVAYDIYKAKYYDAVMAGKMPDMIAEEVVDTAVNMGVSRAGEFLQRALNLVTDKDLTVDGLIGNATISALNSYMTKRNDEKTLYKILNSFQGAYYAELAERRVKDRKYVYGWFKNRV